MQKYDNILIIYVKYTSILIIDWLITGIPLVYSIECDRCNGTRYAKLISSQRITQSLSFRKFRFGEFHIELRPIGQDERSYPICIK